MSDPGSGLGGAALLAGHSPLTPEQASALPQAPRFDRDHEVSFSLTASDIKRLEAMEAEMRQQGPNSPAAHGAKNESQALQSVADSSSSEQAAPSNPPPRGRVDVAVRPVATSKVKLNLPATEEGAAEKPDPNTKS
jgi:hypothetical protein